MKVYQSKNNPLTETEPSGSGFVSFISFHRLAREIEGEANNGKKIAKIVVDNIGLNLYWENK